MIESLKYYRKLRKEKRANSVQYEVFPAIAFSERVVQEASTSPDKVFRQGLLVKTEDTNEYYYIGGILHTGPYDLPRIKWGYFCWQVERYDKR